MNLPKEMVIKTKISDKKKPNTVVGHKIDYIDFNKNLISTVTKDRRQAIKVDILLMRSSH